MAELFVGIVIGIAITLVGRWVHEVATESYCCPKCKADWGWYRRLRYDPTIDAMTTECAVCGYTETVSCVKAGER